jgi:probable F420-dependent oxidoreductase
VELGRIGLWTSALDRQPAAVVLQEGDDPEHLGFGVLWVGEAARREAFVNTSLLLSASTRLVVATGIANIWARGPDVDGRRAADPRRSLGRPVPPRTLGEPPAARDAPRTRYERPLAATEACLEAMDRAPYDAPAPAPTSMARVLGALGPHMLALAAERTDGAHPYLVPPEHTQQPRQTLGPTKLLCPEVAVVLEPDVDDARRIARCHLGTYLTLGNYRSNLSRLGYNEDDLAGQGSDRLVDTVVGCGPLGLATRRVHEHLNAGADHMAIQVLTDDPTRLPLKEWRLLARSLLG